MALVIKAKLGDDVRRVEIEETDFKNLKRTLRRLFALGDTDFTVKYLDDEGDAVSLTCDKELQEALHFVVPANPRPFLRLTVHPVTPVPTPAPTPIAAPEPASPASAPAPPAAAAPAPRGRCPYAAQRRQQRQQAHQQARQHPAAAFPLPFHLLRGVPLAAFAQQQSQQPQQPQQSCNAAINDVVSGLMAQPEIRQLAETFGIKPDAVPSQVDELLRAFLPTPPQQPEQQETKGKEKEDKPSSASSSIPTNVNDLFQNEELRQLISAFGLKPDDVAGEVDSLLRNVLPPEFFNNTKSEEKEKETPKQSAAETVKHHAWCDRCNTQIEGVRFKCGMCSDYDLCESCEALTATDSSVHDPTHLFIKVRQSTYLGTFPLIRGVVRPGPAAASASQCRAGWRQRRGGCQRQWWQQQQQSEAPEDVTVVVDVIVEPEVLEAINKAKAATAEPVVEPETQQPAAEPVAEPEPEPVSVPSSPVPTPKTETVVIEELDEEEKVVKVTPLVRLVPHSAPAPAATPAPVPEEALPKSEPIVAAVVEPVQEPKKEEYRFAAEAEQLAAMGFTDAIANRLALDQNGGNLIAAVNVLLG